MDTRTPEETAVSIAAELIQLRWGGSGRPLTATNGRIHPVTAVRQHRDPGEHGAQQQQLLREMACLPVNELRQHGREEDDRLGIADTDGANSAAIE